MRVPEMVDLERAYAGRRVLVTGHTGFKGGWLCHLLHALGADVYGLALAPEAESLFERAHVARCCDHSLGDIRDLHAVRRTVERARPEIVFHLAAQALVLRSYADPVETFASNVMGTAHVLEALRPHETCRAVVVVTSDKVYDNVERQAAYHEGDRLGGSDPYSASKACAELVAQSYARSFFKTQVGIATARAGNVIGGGDFAENRLLPDIVRAARRGERVVLRNPRATRPWQHVLDPLAGYLTLGARLLEEPHSFAKPYNFGPDDDGYSVEEVARRFAALVGIDGVETRPDSGAAHEAKLLRVDAGRAHRELGVRCRYDLGRSLELTADWYRAYLRGEDVAALTRAQVQAFLG